MPRTVACPTCRAEVKVSRDAEPGTELTCPECAEVFVPQQLKKKDYDPREEEGYAVGGVVKDRDRAEKRRKAKALVRHGRRENRAARRSSSSPGALGGMEGVILILAVVAGAALVLGYVVAKRAPRPGEAALIIVGYCGMVLLFGWRKIIGARFATT
jgi:hypothetical protein